MIRDDLGSRPQHFRVPGVVESFLEVNGLAPVHSAGLTLASFRKTLGLLDDGLPLSFWRVAVVGGVTSAVES